MRLMIVHRTFFFYVVLQFISTIIEHVINEIFMKINKYIYMDRPVWRIKHITTGL